MNEATLALPITEVEALAREAGEATAKAVRLRAVEITSLELRTAFAGALAEVQAHWERHDAKQKAATKAPLALVAVIRDAYRAPKEAYEALETLIKGKLRDFEVRTAMATTEALARAQALSAAGDAAGAAAALATLGGVPENAPGMQVRHPWKMEVINLEIVPIQFHLPHFQALEAERARQVAERPDEMPVIPGVKFWRELQVTGAPTEPGDDGKPRRRRAKK